MKQNAVNDDFEEMDYDLDYAAIGGRIRIQRKNLGISQATLAEKIGISTTHMSHIETGSTKLSLATFVHIAETLNVSADTLLFPENAKDTGIVIAGIVRSLYFCSPKELSIISDIVRSVITSIKKNRD
ncbi:MAG: helix-turn-helix domain-containing protein [Lachnospiraceae bacterium]|nr:helix-turn-helix domain-containing protein [Lachnospiraceae bacterium]